MSLMDRMDNSGVNRDVVTFNSAIGAATRSGRVDIALSLLRNMTKRHCVTPDKATYSTIIQVHRSLLRGLSSAIPFLPCPPAVPSSVV